LNGPRHLVTRHWKLITAVVLAITTFLFAYRMRGALFPFVIGGIIAYVVLPLLSRIEARLPWQGRFTEAKRIFLVVAFFIVSLGLFFLLSLYIGRAMANSLGALVANAPEFFSSAFARLGESLEPLRSNLSPEWQAHVDEALTNAGNQLGNALTNVLSKSASLIPASVGFIFGLVTLPFFLFYLLKDSRRLGRGFYAGLPPWLAGYARDIIGIVDNILGRYIRAQLMLGLIVGTLVFIGLMILSVPNAPLLAVVAGLTEMVPILGPWIGGAIGVLVTLALAPEKALWVAVVFLAVQILENSLLVPRVQSAYLGLHPVVIIVLLPLGAEIAGFWGIVLAVPLTATAVKIYEYIQHTTFSEDARPRG